jgi:RNA polymerase sigma-70 factor (ECF subfamily)
MVVLLSDVNDFKYKEIAKMLNCPIGTVMSRLNRGRRILARNLKSYALEGGVVSPAMLSAA